jgi:Fe-S-cluster-containing dehydrogenase component
MGMNPACAEACPCGAIHFVTRGQALELATPEYENAHKKVMEHVRPVLPTLPKRSGKASGAE